MNRVARRGRVAPWLLVVLVFFTTFTLVRLQQRSAPGFWRAATGSAGQPARAPRAPADAGAVRGWQGELDLAGDLRLAATVTPYHEDAGLESFRSARLRERRGLPEGSLWRAVLALHGDGDDGEDARVEHVSVSDERGEALVCLTDAPAQGAAADPLETLYAFAPFSLAPLPKARAGQMGHPGQTGHGRRTRQVALWGRTPLGDARLDLRVDGRSLALVLEPVELDAVPRWFARGPDVAPRTDARDRRIAELEAELERERARRRERELEWVQHNRALARLDLGALAAFDVDPAHAPSAGAGGEDAAAGGEDAADGGDGDAPGEPTEEDEAAAARRARAGEIRLSLSTLLRLEGMGGMDLLAVGELGDGWIGPVLFRTLDERGRLTGSIAAERLRLEADSAAQMLTIILEEGYEASGGWRTPFAGGIRRVVLPYVDPGDWVEAMPELFSEHDLERVGDDGVWNLGELRRELNRLLALETSMGWYRVHSLAGVAGEELLEVHLLELDASGRIERRLFADRLSLDLGGPGIVLVLRDGAVVHGDQKQGFRDGTYRIFLPRAPLADWRAAALPGLSATATEEGATEDGEAGEEGGDRGEG